MSFEHLPLGKLSVLFEMDAPTFGRGERYFFVCPTMPSLKITAVIKTSAKE